MNVKGKKREVQTYTSTGLPFPAAVLTEPNNLNAAAKLADLQDLVKWLRNWAWDMERWGQDMRDDLIRLEGQAGFPSGDPGDPPGGPPE